MTSGAFVVIGDTVDITPDKPTTLAGYGGRHGTAHRLRDPIEANAVAIADEDRNLVVFVSIDVLYLGDLSSRIRSQLTDISDTELVLAASHTHFAPPTEPLLRRIGEPDEHFLATASARITTLIESVAEGARRHRADICVLRYSNVEHQSAVNRRRPSRLGRRAPTSAPNPSGMRDDRVRTVVARSLHDGTVQAVLWGHACHPVGSPDVNAVSADFPGAIRRVLRNVTASSVPVVYLQGFSGNLRPYPGVHFVPRSSQELKRIIRTGTRGFGRFSENGWNRWCDAMADALVSAIHQESSPLPSKIASWRATIPLSRLLHGVPEGIDLSLHIVRLGEDVTFIGISAEVIVEFLPLFASRFHGEIVPVGCIDRTVGYLPTRIVLEEGGYEAGGFAASFGTAWTFQADPEQTVLDLIDAYLADQPCGSATR